VTTVMNGHHTKSANHGDGTTNHHHHHHREETEEQKKEAKLRRKKEREEKRLQENGGVPETKEQKRERRARQRKEREDKHLRRANETEHSRKTLYTTGRRSWHGQEVPSDLRGSSKTTSNVQRAACRRDTNARTADDR